MMLASLNRLMQGTDDSIYFSPSEAQPAHIDESSAKKLFLKIEWAYCVCLNWLVSKSQAHSLDF